MPLLTCFICTKNTKESLCKRLSEKCHPIQSKLSTILDMLKFCIPKLLDEGDISADDIICTKCLTKLKACVEFVELCLVAINNKHKFKEEILKVEIVDCERNVVETVLVDIKHGLKETNSGQSDTNQESFDDERKEKFSTENIFNESITKYNTDDNGQSDTKQVLIDDRNESNVQDVAGSWEETDIKLEVQCDFCKEQFFTDDILKEHIAKHHSKKPKTKKSRIFSCEECQIKFKSQKVLKDHLESAHSITTFSCKKCGKEFSNQLKLTAHKDFYKDIAACKLQCERCGREYKNRPDFFQHLENLKQASTCDYKICKVCSQKFSKEKYKKHLVIHPQNICETCGEGFPSRGSLSKHAVSHNEPDQAICPVCGKGFGDSERVNQHLKYFHKYAERKHPCPRCPRKFFHKHQLELHIKRHDNIKDVPCPECGRMFLSKNLLQIHINAIHLKLRPFACTQCDKKFTRKQYLRDHVGTHIRSKARKIENPGLPVKCYHCGKIFKDLYMLKHHIKLVHVRVRQYKCEFCEMRFICKNSQMRHQENHKDPLYKFRCTTCYKRNKSEEELAIHLRKHKKFPFKCSICDGKFGRSYLLENHMLSEHPDAECSKPQDIIDEALQNAVFIAGSDWPSLKASKDRRGRPRSGAKS